MLRPGRGSSNRGARGGSPSSRGTSSSRGRGRGVPNSSGKLPALSNVFKDYGSSLSPAPKHGEFSGSRSRSGRGKGGHNRVTNRGQASSRGLKRDSSSSIGVKYSRSTMMILGTAATSTSATAFDQERLQNAAKREQNNSTKGGTTGKEPGGGGIKNKSVRFKSPLADTKPSTMVEPVGAAAVDPFAIPSSTSPFGTTSNQTASSFNPFAASPNPFGSPLANIEKTNSALNPFEGSSQSKLPKDTKASNPFGTPSAPAEGQAGSIFGAPSSLKPAIKSTSFGSPSSPGNQIEKAFASPLGATSPVTLNNFGTTSSLPSTETTIFGTLSRSVIPTTASNRDTTGQQVPTSTFGKSSTSPGISHVATSRSNSVGPKHSPAVRANTPAHNNKTPKTALPQPKGSLSQAPAVSGNSTLAREINNLLIQKAIIAPKWPTSSPGDPRQKANVESFWQTTKAYRAKVRACLMQNGYLDDPERPKKLSEAINFKGICEEMCPEFERITRIMEHDVQGPEKELSPDGQTYWPSVPKMVKALARSAAGQDAPLPDDVRSPAALRRTLDYLIDTVLGDNDLETVHGFLWDRTRAIRRDFVFQQSSMSSQELVDQVYCLELITRFHVVALHQMSREDIVAEDFSEQQEVEQLGKALLSLIHAYEDCHAQGIQCENESEFRAYYAIFNSHNPAILEAVQDWGWKAWGESEDIRTAVCLVETLQNIWDTKGPLRPHLATEIAQNAFHRFFTIVEDSRTSYTMACFAEIHFNKVRKAALKTILAGYRKQRDQTRDWTLIKLNTYLRFDDEQDIIPFGEAYGLHFVEYDGEDCLSFDSDDTMTDPFPQLKQPHSFIVVERKRGDHSLPEVIHQTVYEDPSRVRTEDENIFVPLSPANKSSQFGKAKNALTSTEPPKESSREGVPGAWAPAHKKVVGNATDGQFANLNQSPQDQPPQSSFNPFAPVAENRSFTSSTFPNQEAILRPGVDASVEPLVGSASAQGKSAFSFLGGSRNAPQSNYTLPSTSLFTPKSATTSSSLSAAIGQPLNPSQNLGYTAPPPTTSINGGLDPIPKLTNPSNPAYPSTSIFSSPSNGAPSQPLTSIFPATLSSTEMPSAPASVSVAYPSTLSQSMSSSHITSKISEQKPKIASVASESSNSSVGLLGTNQHSVTPPNLKPQLDAFAKWVVLGERGLIEQFTEYTVQRILRTAVNDFVMEEVARSDKLARDTADRFRYRSLATKYGYMWRKNAQLIWLKRKGRAAREARRQMAESLRASREAESRSVVEEFKSSQRASKRKSTEKLLSESANSSGLHEPKQEIQSIIRIHNKRPTGYLSPETSHKRKSLSDNTSRDKNHRRIQSEDLRKSALKDPSTLPGGSMIHLLPNWSPEMESNRTPQPSGVKTDYFRLKARGIMTLPDGTPLARTAAMHLLSHKRSFDSISHRTSPDDGDDPLTPRSMTAKSVSNMSYERKEESKGVEDIQAIKQRAKDIMAMDQETRQMNKKRHFDDEEEEELFAKAKRIREQMDEGAEFFRSEMQKSFSRSTS